MNELYTTTGLLLKIEIISSHFEKFIKIQEETILIAKSKRLMRVQAQNTILFVETKTFVLSSF